MPQAAVLIVYPGVLCVMMGFPVLHVLLQPLARWVNSSWLPSVKTVQMRAAVLVRLLSALLVSLGLLLMTPPRNVIPMRLIIVLWDNIRMLMGRVKHVWLVVRDAPETTPVTCACQTSSGHKIHMTAHSNVTQCA